MKQEIAVRHTHTTPIVPKDGYLYDNKDFVESVRQYLEIEICPEIRGYTNFNFTTNYFTLTVRNFNGIGNSFLKRWKRGASISLKKDDIDNFRSFIRRRIAVEKEIEAKGNIYGKYEKILAPILSTRPDKVSYTGLVISEGQPIITLHFDNGMIAFIDTKMQVSYEWEKTVSNAEQAREYVEKFNGKLSEILQPLQNVIGLVPVEFWEGAQNAH